MSRPTNIPKFNELTAKPDDIVGKAFFTALSYADRLHKLAFTNPVTGLPNRNAFDHELALRLQEDKNIAVALVDVTKFKLVNDRYGHLTGDRVLRSMGELIIANTRQTDYVAHLQGDEFAAILDLEPHKDFTMTADERVLHFRENFIGRVTNYAELSFPKELGVNGAIGIVLRQPGQTAEELFEAADAQMYLHKAEQHAATGTVPR